MTMRLEYELSLAYQEGCLLVLMADGAPSPSQMATPDVVVHNGLVIKDRTHVGSRGWSRTRDDLHRGGYKLRVVGSTSCMKCGAGRVPHAIWCSGAEEGEPPLEDYPLDTWSREGARSLHRVTVKVLR